METREDVIKRQDQRSDELSNLYGSYMLAKEKYEEIFRNITDEPPVFPGLDKTSKKSVNLGVVKAYESDDPKIKETMKAFVTAHPVLTSPETKKLLSDFNEKKYLYYRCLCDYMNMIDNDYKELFADEYKKKTFALADNGIFLFYEMTPDSEPFLVDDLGINMRFVLDSYSKDDFERLRYLLRNIIKNGYKSTNSLQKTKTVELCEAVACLMNGCFSSCARTMLALMENEHTNASNLDIDFFKKPITTGFNRSFSISKQLGDINISYLSDCWERLDSFYREITISISDKSKRFINRNEIVHGAYEDAIIPDKDTCIELILFYLSFKRISYFLQRVYDMKFEIENDLLCLKATEESKHRK